MNIDGRASEDTLVRYLLGQLSEEEQQRIERHSFDDDEFFRQILEVEDDLRCAYAAGSLPLADREQFEKRFLIFADERERIELAREMIAELPQTDVGEAEAPAPRRIEPQSQRSKSFRFLGLDLTAMNPAFRWAAFFVVAGLIWLLFETVRLRSELSRLQGEQKMTEAQIAQRVEQQSAEQRYRINELSRQLDEERARRVKLQQELEGRTEPAAAPERSGVVALLLTPGLVRSGGETRRLVLSEGAEAAQLRLELTEGDYSGYRAVVMNAEGREVLNRAGLRSRLDGARRVVILNIPARLLAEDDYELILTYRRDPV